MSFAEKHPYLFWQLIGWGILLIDFVFVVIAVFNGEPGGTKNTLDFAQRSNVPCVVIDG